MSTEVKIPALGESISSGVLSSWKVPEGSFVEIDQPIYELETDKITQEGLAEVAGVISFLASEGDEVEIGATIAKIDESAEKSNTNEDTVGKEEPNSIEISLADDNEIQNAQKSKARPSREMLSCQHNFVLFLLSSLNFH